MPPVKRWFYSYHALGLREGLSEVPRHIVMPGDMCMHQRVEWIEFDDPSTRREGIREPRRGARRVGIPVVRIDPRGIQRERLVEFFARPIRVPIEVQARIPDGGVAG